MRFPYVAAMKPLINVFACYIRQCSLIEKGDRVLIAVSGGPDSVALLRLLFIVQKKLNLKLFVGHYNHGLRGKESDGDESFVRDLCRSCGVAFYSGKERNRRSAGGRKGFSPEERARIGRYRFLFALARRLGAVKLATAHTMDDQAETVMMRIIRGAGLRGLSSIPSKRREKGVWIVRPLLKISRSDILSFLERDGSRFRMDSSNRSCEPLRNRIRLELMPFICAHFNPKFQKNLVDLAQISEGMYDFVLAAACSDYQKLSRRISQGVRLSRRKLARIHPSIRMEIYFLAVQNILGSRNSFSRKHLQALDALLFSRGLLLEQLPCGIRVKKTKESLVIRRG